MTPITKKLLMSLTLVMASCLAGCGGGEAKPTGESRYDYPSAIDPSFGDGGYRIYSTGLGARTYLSSFNVTNFTVDHAGRVVVIGNRTSTDREAWVLRLRPDGTADSTCGTDGWSAWTTGGPANPYKIKEMPDGRYAVGGTLGTASVWMLRADCSIDTSWGTNGKAAVPTPSATEITGAANEFDIGADGSIVVTVSDTLSGRLLVGKLLPNGSPDTSFGTSGYASVAPIDHGSPQPAAIKIRPSGAILVAATFVYSNQVGQLPGFAQLTSTGQLDTTFGDAGFQIQNPGTNLVGIPKSMVLLPDGSAIQAGMTQPGVVTGTVIDVDAYWMKINSAGQVDSTFGPNGISTWTAGPTGRSRSTNYASSIAIDRSGNIATCMNWTNNTEESSTQTQAAPLQVLVQMRNTSGNLISSYGTGGTASLPRANGFAEKCVGLASAIDGSLIGLMDYGPALNATGPTLAIVRLAH